MKQTQVPIEKATTEQLVDFGETFLQILGLTGLPRADVLAKIQPAWRPDFIYADGAELDSEDQDDEAGRRARLEIPLFRKFKDPRWLLVIGKTTLPGGEDPVAVSVNSDLVVIQRDMEVEVPHRFVEALRNAVKISMSQNMETQEITYNRFTNYPIEVIERPSKSEIEAFIAETARTSLGIADLQSAAIAAAQRAAVGA